MTARQHHRILIALATLLTLSVWGACSHEPEPEPGPGEETPTVIPVDLSSTTRSTFAERANEAISQSYPSAAMDQPVELGALAADLGNDLVEETGDAGLLGAEIDPSVFSREPVRLEPEDLRFFVIGAATAGASNLLAPDAPSGSDSGDGTRSTRTADSAWGTRPNDIGDARLAGAVSDLLDLLDSVGVDTEALRVAWSRARFHEEGEFPGGLPEGVEGTTFLWKNDGGFRLSGFSFWLLVWWDGYHHVVLSADHSLHLRAGLFEDDGRLTGASIVALRELARIVMAETGCASDSPERILADLTDVLEGAFALEAARDIGLLPSTADVLTYHNGVRDALANGGTDCLTSLGLPVAGSMAIEAPEEVPVGTSIEVTGTLTWPDGSPAIDQYVVLRVGGLHQVVRTDSNGRASHAFPAGDAPGTVEARAAALGRSANTDVRVVAGDSGACCLPDDSCVVAFPEDCTSADGAYLGTDTACEPEACDEHGACCDGNGGCVLRTLAECTAEGSLFLGGHVPCTPNACPPHGACCLSDGSCVILKMDECTSQDGVFQGEGTYCDPFLCTSGACCFPDGSCRQDTEEGCANLEGEWQGPGTACELVPCARPGACCLPDGSCGVTLRTDCHGAFQGDDSSCDPSPCPQPGACCAADGSCRVALPADCNADFAGPGTTCDPNPCPQPGACCAADGSCAVALAADCDGQFSGPGTNCDPNPCPQPPSGACCWGDGTRCTVRTEGECHGQLGGTYLGDGTNCFGEPCAEATAGACCLSDGRCIYVDPVSCAASPGEFLGAGVLCSEQVCPDPVTGACCFETGSCQIRTEESCVQNGGTYQGDGLPCDPNPCEGACCFPSGVCQVLTEEDCVGQGGDYLGAGSVCETDICAHTGACCLPEGECLLRTGEQCADAQGEYLGDDSVCEPETCVPTGACCLPDGDCTTGTETQCADAQGEYLGDDSVCDPGSCVRTGACCPSEGGECTIGTAADCAHSDGIYQGDDTVCTPESCPVPGACCIGGGCTVETEFDCSRTQGEFQGEGTTCQPDPCIIQGACCLPDHSCTITRQEDCDGDFLGEDSTCESDPCEPTGACCRPDGTCTLVVRSGCDGFLDAIYQGDGTTCADGCRACCLPDGSCEVLPGAECGARNGSYGGDHCSPNPCVALGACCREDGTCDLLDSSEGCGRSGGAFQGVGSVCDPSPCGDTGACCLQENCFFSVRSACTIVSGEFLGEGTTCHPYPCPTPVPGACCLLNGSCTVVEEAACDGAFQGDGTACEPDPCSLGEPREIQTHVEENEGVTVVRTLHRRGLGRAGSGSGPGDLFVAGRQGVAAYDYATGTFRGAVTVYPQHMFGTVYLLAPTSPPGSDIEAWLLMFGPEGTQQRPWSPTLGWTATQISSNGIYDACAYDNSPDGGGYVYADFLGSAVIFVGFGEDGYLHGEETLHGVSSYASGPPISAFARTAPGGAPGGEALFITGGSPGQLWHPTRGTGQQPELVGTLGNDPFQIRALHEVAVVTNYTSRSLTLVHWPYGGTPTITGTVEVSGTPLGVSLAELPSGNIVIATGGFTEHTITLTVVSPSGQFISNQTMVSPAGCQAPGFATLVEGVGLEVVVSCSYSFNLFVLPVVVE